MIWAAPGRMNFYTSTMTPLLFDLQNEQDPVLQAEEAFLLGQVADAGGPILDLGCGTGRILLPAAQRGFPIYGCDGSVPFLRRLAQKANAQGLSARVWQAGIENPGAGPSFFHLAFAAFRTVNHILDPVGLARFFLSASYLLVPHGKLILNTAATCAEDLMEIHGQKILMGELQYPETGDPILWWGMTRFDERTNIMEEWCDYDFIAPDGRVSSSWHFDFLMRLVSRDEILRLAGQSGFVLVEEMEGFGAYGESPGDIVWIFEKSGADS